MAAATTDRNTRARNGHEYSFPVKAGEVIPAGVIVALKGSVALNGAADVDQVIVGMSTDPADNSAGGDGDIRVNITRQGLRRFGNSASTDAITLMQIGTPCYVVDNQTVAKTSSTGTRPVAGTVMDVDADGVWIKF